MRKLIISAVLLFPAIGLVACMHEQGVFNRAPGKYESKQSSTDASGMTIERQSSTDIDIDEKGNKKAVVKSKTTKDPKGLFNKSTTSKSMQVIEEK